MKFLLSVSIIIGLSITSAAFADQNQSTSEAIKSGATEVNAAPIVIEAKSPLAEMISENKQLNLPVGANKELTEKSKKVEITAADYISSITYLKEALQKVEFEGGNQQDVEKLTQALKKAMSQLSEFESAKSEYIHEKTNFIADKEQDPKAEKTGH